MSDTDRQALEWAVEHYARRAGQAFDNARLHAATVHVRNGLQGEPALAALCAGLGLGRPLVFRKPDPARLPLLTWTADGDWGVVVEQSPEGYWRMQSVHGEQWLPHDALDGRTASMPLRAQGATSRSTSFKVEIMRLMRDHRRVLIEASAASFLLGVLAVFISFFTMQVYDRVIPTGNLYTLTVLFIGVMLMLAVDVAMRVARSRLMEHMVANIDGQLSRELFQRIMQVRVDQFPGSVGTLAAQLQSYEQIRAYYTATTLFAIADLPVTVILIVLIMFIGHPAISAVPLLAVAAGLWLGFHHRKRMNQLAKESAKIANYKYGMLVEAVEGIETIKSGGGSWKFLSRWMGMTGRTLRNTIDNRRLSDNMTFATGVLQQLSYIGMVTIGAVIMVKGQMTMGALIACSILGGRILAPVLSIPSLILQRAGADAALEGIEAVFKLETDNHGIDVPLTPATLRGDYQVAGATFKYQQDETALQIAKLDIKAGERVGIVGMVGSGKSTLLRLLSGLYRPQAGKVLLDGLDLSHISPAVLSRHIGYLQQDHRLFVGSLRENLLIGMPDPGDDALFDAMTRSGLIRLVTAHPMGVNLFISEGGRGLSGGQKQLVAFTRILLMKPNILLLDEPTASMDEQQEAQCLAALEAQLTPQSTLVLVTHRPSLLRMVNRLIVLSAGKIAMDGPRDAVIDRLRRNTLAQEQAPQYAHLRPGPLPPGSSPPTPPPDTPPPTPPTGGAA